MKVLFITDLPLNNTGGLERAGNTFKGWMLEKSYVFSSINKKNFLNQIKKIYSSNLILIIGHRSIFILFCAFFLFLLKKKLAWCAFWHDYKIEKKGNLFFYKIYDKFFNYLYMKSDLHLVVSQYEAKKISTSNKAKKIRLPTLFKCDENELKRSRHIDVLIPGRDVPHKRFKLIRDICVELDLKYVETNSNPLSEEELREAYLSSKYILVPSLYESYSYVTLEGMCCGCNVLVSDNVMIKDNLEGFNNFKVLNSENWEPKIVKRILSKFPPNNQNISNALKIQKEFSISSCKKDFLDTFNLNYDRIIN